MDPARLAALVSDLSLTSDALRLLLFIESRGPGEHEVPLHELKGLFRCRSERPIYDARECAEGRGLRWRAGGRGHNTVYWFVPGAELSDGSATEPNQNPDGSAVEPNQSTWFGQGDEPKPTVVVEEVGSSREEENAREDAPAFHVSTAALAIMDAPGSKFTGCRGALRDYLGARVPTRLQTGYVQTIATWLDGFDAGAFMLPDGGKPPPEELPGLLAAALNELAGTDESKMKRDPGDLGNLRTKLNVLLKQRGRHDRDAQRVSGGGTASGNQASGARRLGVVAGGRGTHSVER